MKARPFTGVDGIKTCPAAGREVAVFLFLALAPGDPLDLTVFLKDGQGSLGTGEVDLPFLAVLVSILGAAAHGNRVFLPDRVDDIGDHAPDHQFLAILEFDGLVSRVRILRQEAHLTPFHGEALDRELAIDDSDDDMAVACLDRAVDDEDVTSKDIGVDHGVAFHPNHEGGGRIADQLLVKVDAVFDMVIGRRRETGRNAVTEEWKGQAGWIDGGQQSAGKHCTRRELTAQSKTRASGVQCQDAGGLSHDASAILAKLANDDTEDLQLPSGADGGIGLIGWIEHELTLLLAQGLQGEFVVDDGDDEITDIGELTLLDDDDIVRQDTGIDHGVAFHGDQRGLGGALDQIGVDTEAVLSVIVCLRGQSSADAGTCQWPVKETRTGLETAVRGGFQQALQLEAGHQRGDGVLGTEA